MAHEHEERTSGARQLITQTIPIRIIMVAVAIMMIAGYQSCTDDDPPPDTGTTPQDSTAVVVQTQRSPWTIQTFENIPEGGLAVHLYPGWKTFPLHGEITITTPSGQILHDEPGVPRHFGWQPEGDYIVRGDPVGSRRGVRIYNRW